MGLPRTAILADEVAVVMDLNQPLSVQIGEHYAGLRGIPATNLVYVEIPLGPYGHVVEVTGDDEAEAVKAQIDLALAARPDVQALVLAWKYPYVVDGTTSITSALSLGGAFVGPWDGGPPTPPPSPYYASKSTMPFTDFGFRPSMLLASKSQTFAEIDALALRGLSADGSYPRQSGYLVRTDDDERNIRVSDMVLLPPVYDHPNGFHLVYEDLDNGDVFDDLLEHRTDVMFYFTGHPFDLVSQQATLYTNTFVAGAVADHVTSAGGVLASMHGSQMKCTEWIAAGASASFGTVSEPGAVQSKFPRVSIFLKNYFAGGSIIDSYWRSVRVPSQGLFVGDPLVRPWEPQVEWTGSTLVIRTNLQRPGQVYFLESADSTSGPWALERVVDSVATPRTETIVLQGADPNRAYRLVPDEERPTTPQWFTGLLNCGAHHFAWSASQDNVGVAGYNVYEVCGAGSKLLGFTPDTGFTYVGLSQCDLNTSGSAKTAPPPGTFFVTAVDTSGNESDPSQVWSSVPAK